jgi:hypothetical protein
MGAEGRCPFSHPKQASAQNEDEIALEDGQFRFVSVPPRSLFSPSIPTARAAPGSSWRCFAATRKGTGT